MERSRRRNVKYQAEEITFRARINPLRLPEQLQNTALSAVVESVRVLFMKIIALAIQGLRSNDLIRFCIQADGLDKPISTELMTVEAVTLEKVLGCVLKVLQSKDQILLDDGFLVDILTIRRDIGGGRIKKVVNIELDRLRKQSILTIPEDDIGLCCAKAIIYALAHLNKDPRINSLRDRRRPNLLNRAKELHEATGIPLGPCTYEEIKKFEQHLDVQVVVISSENLNKVNIFFFSCIINNIFTLFTLKLLFAI